MSVSLEYPFCYFLLLLLVFKMSVLFGILFDTEDKSFRILVVISRTYVHMHFPHHEF